MMTSILMKRAELSFALLRIPVDFAAIVLAAAAAYWSRFLPIFTSVRPVIFDLPLERFLSVMGIIAPVWLAVFAVAGLYTIRRRALTAELARVALACSAAMASVFAILFFSRTFFDSRFIAVAGWLIAIVFVGVGRILVRLLQRLLMRWGIGQHRIVFIGKTKSAEILSELFNRRRELGFRVVASFETFNKTTADKIRKMKRADGVDEIWLADQNASRETDLDLLAFTETEHLGFTYTADYFSSAVGRSIQHSFAGIPVVEVQKTPLDGWGAIYKRLFDIVGSFLLIVVLSPVMLLTAIAIKLDSRGRVFFSRLPNGTKTTRIGQSGRPFTYYKFRSMREGEHFKRYGELAHLDTRQGPLVKLKDDPRVTRVGGFIRKWSIDELAELFLVLVGRMSLVGPRPHLPEEVAKYEPHQRKVLTVKPGITGLAQISGRADLDFDEEVALDVRYIEHWTPWLDLYILLKTPAVVLFRKGAY